MRARVRAVVRGPAKAVALREAGAQVAVADLDDAGALDAALAGAGRVGPTDAHVGADYQVTGPELVTYAQVAATLSAVLGREVTFAPSTFEQDRAAMVAAGVPAAVAEMNARAFSLIARGDAQRLSPTAPTLLGRSGRTFAAFAAGHRSAFA